MPHNHILITFLLLVVLSGCARRELTEADIQAYAKALQEQNKKEETKPKPKPKKKLGLTKFTRLDRFEVKTTKKDKASDPETVVSRKANVTWHAQVSQELEFKGNITEVIGYNHTTDQRLYALTIGEFATYYKAEHYWLSLGQQVSPLATHDFGARSLQIRPLGAFGGLKYKKFNFFGGWYFEDTQKEEERFSGPQYLAELNGTYEPLKGLSTSFAATARYNEELEQLTVNPFFTARYSVFGIPVKATTEYFAQNNAEDDWIWSSKTFALIGKEKDLKKSDFRALYRLDLAENVEKHAVDIDYIWSDKTALKVVGSWNAMTDEWNATGTVIHKYSEHLTITGTFAYAKKLVNEEFDQQYQVGMTMTYKKDAWTLITASNYDSTTRISTLTHSGSFNFSENTVLSWSANGIRNIDEDSLNQIKAAAKLMHKHQHFQMEVFADHSWTRDAEEKNIYGGGFKFQTLPKDNWILGVEATMNTNDQYSGMIFVERKFP